MGSHHLAGTPRISMGEDAEPEAGLPAPRDAAMPDPWLLLAMALTLTLTGVPGGHAQPNVAQQEAAMAAEPPGLDDLLRQAERLLLLREDLQRLRGDQGNHPSESQSFQPDWLSKRQHPGKREEAEERVLEEDEEGGAVGPYKRQHPGRREDVAAWSVDDAQQKRQHPGRRASLLGYAVTKRQHPGRRLVDPKFQRSWEEEEEEEEEGELMPEKRQHPGKRALGGPCGFRGACGQAGLLLGLLDDLRRGQEAEEKRQHPGRRAALAREPLEE
ncbi:thyrotropin releasing hormone isoform X1 [Manis pentadactyla]|uniref:thyrotropin releasing hormone isoform X1 n=2 Tax=Manis pentadactyla TaxID=143292 RepID=UPI00255C9E07|nr:thyrotropin releasing hormone isoform X1 [Manis pentadactyla]KAI5174249.1 Pro-Thyrotropin-Releasing Hormone [Manis pentadactyla]